MGNNAHKSGEQHKTTTQIDESKWQTRSWARDIEIEREREREKESGYARETHMQISCAQSNA